MLAKQKRCGRSKGRTCANDRKQRDNFTKEETEIPTVALKLVCLTSAIDAKWKRDAATLNLPSAFMQTNIEDKCVLMKLRGAVAWLMVRVAPETHSDHTTCENGTPILHAGLLKALHVKVVEDLKKGRIWIKPMWRVCR